MLQLLARLPGVGYLGFYREHPMLLSFGLLLSFTSSLGQTFFIALFSAGIREALELSDADFGYLYSAATLVSAALITWAGKLIDNVDIRIYAGAVCLGLVLGCLSMATVSSVAMLFVALLLLRHFGQGLLGHTAATSMSRYFDAERGKALSIVSLGFPIGEAIFPTLLVLLIAGIGWRWTWGALAVAVLVLTLPMALWLIGAGARRRELVASAAKAASGVGERRAAARDWRREEVLRDPRFYLVLPAVLAPPFIGTGIFFHQVRLVEAKGWDLEWFAASYVVYAVATVVTSLSVGTLVDRYRGSRLLPLYLLPQAGALILLATSDGAIIVPLYMVGAGITAGAGSPIVGAMWAEAYGVLHLGAIRSLVQALMVFSTACAPGPLGYLIDRGVSFESIASMAVGYVAVSTALTVWALRLGRRQERVLDADQHAGFDKNDAEQRTDS